MTRKKTKAGTGLGSSKSKVNITLTPEANETLVALVKETGLTKSKFFEEVLVGGIVINSKNAETKVVLNGEDEEQKFSIAKLEDSDRVDESDSESISLESNAIEQEIKNQQRVIAELEEQINKQKNLVADKSKVNEDLKDKLQEQQNKVQIVQSELEEKNHQIKTLESDLKNALAGQNNDEVNDHLKDLQKELKNAQNSLTQANNNIKSLNEKIISLESLITEKDAHIQGLKNELKNNNNQINKNDELNAVIETQKQEINNYRQQIAHKEQEKVALSQNYATKQNTLIQHLTKENAEQKGLIASLNQRIADLEPRANIGDRLLNKWR